MKTLKYKFTINMPQYVKRFGIELPDDSMDVTLTNDDGGEDGEATDEAIVEDANVNVDNSLLTPAQLKCKTPFDKCEAKNPMTCRYHGARVIAADIENQLRADGITGKVNVELVDVNGDTLSVMAKVEAEEADEDKVSAAMDKFFQLPGVTGDSSTMMYDDTDKMVGGLFEIDMLDPGAKAKWGIRDPQSGGSNSNTSTAQAANPTMSSPASTTRKRPTRKRTGAAAKAVQQPTEEKPTEPVVQETQPAMSSAEEDDENGPTLFPGEGPKEPPKWNPDYTNAEIDELKKMMVRLAKTARQINRNIDKGKTDTWLAKKAPNLPDSLQKFKNEIDGQRLADLAAKDNDGQVKAMKDLMDEILASEANGWKTKVAESKWDGNAPSWWDANKEGNVDIHFDEHKYDDPYAKERAAFEAYVPGSKGREDALKGLGQIDNSSAKDAPKNEANACREAAKQMSQLEDAFNTLKGMSDVFKNAFGRAYFKANEALKSGLKKCKDWIGKQFIAQDSIGDVIEAYKRQGIEVPEELINMQDVEDKFIKPGWEAVAAHYNLDVNDKSLIDCFKKNIKTYFLKCPTCSSYNIEDICEQILDNRTEYTQGYRAGKTRLHGKMCTNNHRFHASNRSYVATQNAVFGLNEKKNTKSSKLKMHAYGTVCGMPFCEVPESMMYQGDCNCCTMLVNPKQAPIAFFGQYYGTSNWFNGNYGSIKNRNYTGSYVNNANPSMFASNPRKISKDAFTKDLSSLSFDDLQNALGFDYQTGEAWMIGGIHENAILAIKEQSGVTISDKRIKEFNKKGITILDQYGNIKGKDCIPEDSDLINLVWGKNGRPKKK